MAVPCRAPNAGHRHLPVAGLQTRHRMMVARKAAPNISAATDFPGLFGQTLLASSPVSTYLEGEDGHRGRDSPDSSHLPPAAACFMHTTPGTMKPQSKPFTVAVKRRKLSPEGKKKSVWSDVSHLIAAAESDLARDEHEAPAAAAKAPAKAEPSAVKSDAAPTRQPRILQSRASEPVMAEPEADPEPVDRPVRRRGRPRKAVAEAPQPAAAVAAREPAAAAGRARLVPHPDRRRSAGRAGASVRSGAGGDHRFGNQPCGDRGGCGRCASGGPPSPADRWSAGRRTLEAPSAPLVALIHSTGP